jgi:tetratricopeptide (TPR) repeat protein
VLDPTDPLVHYNRGSLLKDLKRFHEALASFDSAIAANAQYAEAYVNRGNLLLELQRHEAAAASFARAIELKPTIAEAFQGRGVSLYALKRLGLALADYTQAIALKPDLAALYLNRGNLLSELLNHDAAIADYLKATELDPEDGEAHHCLGWTFLSLKKLDIAIASFDKAMALSPSRKYLIGTCRMAKMQACHWDGLVEDLDLISKGVRAGEHACMPMILAGGDLAARRGRGSTWTGRGFENLRRRARDAPDFRVEENTHRIFLGRFAPASCGKSRSRPFRASRPVEIRDDRVRVRSAGQ